MSEQVTFHPSVIAQIRRWSRADFLGLDPDRAKFYLEHGLVAPASGQVVDIDHKPTGETIYVLTPEALALAFPDGVPVHRYVCKVCGKDTGGRMSTGADCTWYPRRHKVEGVACPGNDEPARIVVRKRKIRRARGRR